MSWPACAPRAGSVCSACSVECQDFVLPPWVRSRPVTSSSPGFRLRPEIDGRAPRPDRACLHGRSADPLSKAPHGRGTAQRGKNCRRRAASHGTLVGIFRMPSLGADKEAGTLVEWLRQPAAPPARIAAPISRSAPRLSHWARPRRYKAVSRHPPLPETRHRAGARPHVGIRQRTGWRGAFHGRRSPANS